MCTEAGCTAVAAVVRQGTVTVANAGDSRAVLCRAGKAIALSFDHKPDNPREKRRIQEVSTFCLTVFVFSGLSFI